MDPASPKKKYNRKHKKSKNCKPTESSDSDDSDFIPNESDDSEQEYDTLEYKKLLQTFVQAQTLFIII